MDLKPEDMWTSKITVDLMKIRNFGNSILIFQLGWVCPLPLLVKMVSEDAIDRKVR